MLSNPKKITSAKQASSYYKQADYYTKGEDGVDISSAWLGQGAKELELEGFVEHKDLEAVMAGVLPDGTVLDHANRVVGWDLTFSAPKSISVMALVGGDDRLMDAHFEALKDATKFAENEFAVTRKTEGGVTNIEKTMNYLISAFTHTTSRALDPALHTHTLFMNATKNNDGEWRAIESNPLYDNRMLLGLVYQTSLSRRAFELGYDLVRDDKTGQFDLIEVPRTVIDEFSQRRNDIKKIAEERGIALNDAKGMEDIALSTRKSKQNVSTSQIISDWEERAGNHDFDYQAIIDNAKVKSSERIPSLNKERPLNVLRLAIENLSFKESVFSRQNLMKEAFRFDQHAIDVNLLSEQISLMVDQGELLETRIDELGQIRQIGYTTPESIDREMEILGLVKAGTGQSQSMGTHAEITDFIKRYNTTAEHGLNESQTAALIGLATNNDIHQGLQGLPGVGKSTLMHATNAFANEQGIKLVGIAPTGTAAQELYHKAKMDTRTIDSLLEIDKHRDKEKYIHEPNTIYVVDESGMVSDRHTVALMRLNHMEGSRMIDAGDINQLPSLEAGAPFEQKQKLSYAFEVMNDVKRQRNPLLKKMVYEAIDHSIAKAFKTLEKSADKMNGISNIEKPEKRLEASVKYYMELVNHYTTQGDNLSKIVNHNVKLVTPLNATKDDSNHAIREHLKSNSLINNSSSMTLLTLLPKGISPTEQHQAIGFNTYFDKEGKAGGDVIRFHKDIKPLGVKQGDYFHVMKTASVGFTTLGLRHAETGHNINIDMSKYTDENTMTVFSASRKEISIGEQLRWRDTYQTTDIKNGQSLEVTNIDPASKTYSVRVDDGRIVTLPQNYTGGHNDYNYAITPNSFQGGSAKHVILNYGQTAKRVLSRNNLIVSLTRGISGTYLFADNANRIAQTADRNNRTKTSALDSIGQRGSHHTLDTPKFKRDVLAAKEGVEKAIEHLSGQFSAFTTYEVMRHAMRFSGQDSAPVRAAIKNFEESKKLVRVKTSDNHQTYFTSKEITSQERKLRAHMKQLTAPISLNERQLENATSNYALFDESTQTLRALLNSPHRVSILNTKQNSEGTLFNHALSDALSAKRKTFVFVAPINQAHHTEKLGHDVLTTAQFARNKKAYDIVVVLDSHNASASALKRVLDKVEKTDSRVFLQGMTSISQEFAHKNALSNLAKVAKKQTQIHDLLASPSQIVDLLAQQVEGLIPTAIKRELEKEALVIQSESSRQQKIVKDYLAHPEHTSIISASKEGSKKMSELVRIELIKRGELKKTQIHNTISPVYLSPQQKQIATEYVVGQIILFNRKGEKDGFTRQETYVVEKINGQENSLVLRSSTGTRTISVHELKTNGFSVNEQKHTEIGEGEKLRFPTGIHTLNIQSNASGKVITANHEARTLQVELESGRKIELDLNNRSHQFIAHGYTQSMNQSAKLPMRNNALIELDGRFKSSANVQSFLKALSNAKHSVSLYADKRSTVSNYVSPSKDKERSIESILHKDTQKVTAEAKAHEQTEHRQRTQEHMHTEQQHEVKREQQRER